MANPVNKAPQLSGEDLILLRTVLNELREHAYRLNLALVMDGSEAMTGPLSLLRSTVAGLSAWPAATYPGATIIVTNEAGGYTMAFSDGTSWRRVQDRVVVS